MGRGFDVDVHVEVEVVGAELAAVAALLDGLQAGTPLPASLLEHLNA